MDKINDLRQKIDILDEEIVKLLSQRFSVVREIWNIKKSEKIPALQQGRWDEVVTRIKTLAIEHNIPPGTIEKIWNQIHETALDLESKI